MPTQVRLVFDNATTFNKDADEPVHQAAVALGAKFEERFADARGGVAILRALLDARRGSTADVVL